MDKSVNILKVRILKQKKGNGLTLLLESSEGGDGVTSNEVHKAIIHKDLQDGVDALGLHLAIMTGYISSNVIEDIAAPDLKLAEKFHVNGYSIGGDDDNQGIVISGYHILRNGLAVILNTPFSRFEVAPESRYVYMDDLMARVTNIEKEISLYLSGEKRGTPAQGEMDFKEEKVTKMKVATPLDEKVSPEAKLAGKSDQHKYAGKAQMEGVAEMGKEKKLRGKATKKVAQTAENPDGIAPE